MKVNFWLSLVTLLGSLRSTKGSPVNITIGLLQSDSNSSFALERALPFLSNRSNIKLILKAINIKNWTRDSSRMTSDKAFSEISVIIGTKISAKITTIATKILRIPLITIQSPFCPISTFATDSSCQDEFSMIPSKRQLSLNIFALLQWFSWSQVAIIFQTKRTDDLNDFIKSIGRSFTLKLIPIESNSNGSVTDHSIARMKLLTSSQINALILIYDEADLPELFALFHSDAVALCSVKMKIIIMDLLFNESMNVCNLHTVLGMQIQKHNGSNGDVYLANSNETLGVKPNLKDVLLHDALALVANVTDKLVTLNRWLVPNKDVNAFVHAGRVSNTANFTAELKKVQLDGVSGNIEFAADGSRHNMTVNIVNFQENRIVEIGRISANKDIRINESPSPNVKRDLKDIKINAHLRVVTVVDEPFTFETINSNGSIVYTGFCVDLLEELSKLLNFTYSVYSVADNEYGRKKDGKWTGMIGDVLYEKADIAAASLTITSSREEVIQFAKPYMELQNSYVRRRTTRMPFDPLQFLKPFTGNVWIITVFAGIISSIAIYCIDYYSPFGWRQTIKESTGKDGDTFNSSNSAWFCVASWLLQGGDNTPKSLSGRTFVGTLWFVILIVTSTYTANMAAYFTFKKSVTEKEDIESLLKAGVSFALKQHTALDQFLKNSDYRVYQLLAQKISEQKKYVANATEGINVARLDPNLLFLGEGPYSEWLMNKGACDLKIVNGILPSRSYGFPLRKGSAIAEKISIGISHLEESNFIQKTKDHYWKELSQCKDSNIFSAGITEEGRIEPLQLAGFYSLLLVGIVTSFAFLFVEKWWKKNSAEKKRKFTTVIRRIMVKRQPLGFNSNWLPNVPSQNNTHENQEPKL